MHTLCYPTLERVKPLVGLTGACRAIELIRVKITYLFMTGLEPASHSLDTVPLSN